jgi:hypothetical protein
VNRLRRVFASARNAGAERRTVNTAIDDTVGYNQHSQDTTMPKLFSGNSAVLIGIAIAAPCIWLSRKLGDPYFDLGAVMAIGLLLISAAFVLARKNGGLESPSREALSQPA